MLCLSSSFLLCSRCVARKYAFVSRFKGVFSGFWGACVGLHWLRALRGLWGFCVRERLGGLKACGVFAFLFILFVLLPFSFCLSFYIFASAFCPSPCLLCYGCLLLVLLSCLSCFVVVGVAFSLSDKTKKERICFALFLYLVLVSLF